MRQFRRRHPVEPIRLCLGRRRTAGTPLMMPQRRRNLHCVSPQNKKVFCFFFSKKKALLFEKRSKNFLSVQCAFASLFSTPRP
jgi:hypothetical protein